MILDKLLDYMAATLPTKTIEPQVGTRQFSAYIKARIECPCCGEGIWIELQQTAREDNNDGD